jgi:hypothetical protein
MQAGRPQRRGDSGHTIRIPNPLRDFTCDVTRLFLPARHVTSSVVVVHGRRPFLLQAAVMLSACSPSGIFVRPGFRLPTQVTRRSVICSWLPSLFPLLILVPRSSCRLQLAGYHCAAGEPLPICHTTAGAVRCELLWWLVLSPFLYTRTTLDNLSQDF